MMAKRLLVYTICASLFPSLLLLCGCGHSDPEKTADAWFPFTKGAKWLMVDPSDHHPQRGKQIGMAGDTQGCYLVVQDAAQVRGSSTAILKVEGMMADNEDYLPTSMKVTANKAGIELNFLLGGGFMPHMEMDPPIPILKTPILEGNSWTWTGKVVLIDPNDSADKRRRVDSNAVIKLTTGDFLVFNEKEKLRCAVCTIALHVREDFPGLLEQGNLYVRIWMSPSKGIVSYELSDSPFRSYVELKPEEIAVKKAAGVEWYGVPGLHFEPKFQ